MRRQLFHFAAAVSLLLCIVTVCLWVGSYFRFDHVIHTVMPRDGANWYWRNRTVSSADGGVLFIERGYLVTTPGFADNWAHKVNEWEHAVYMPWQNAPRPPFPGNHWFDFDRRVNLTPRGSLTGPEILHIDILTVRLPYWLVALVTGVAPAMWLVRRRREARRARKGLCPCCGYDLRASAERCPECGLVLVGESSDWSSASERLRCRPSRHREDSRRKA